MTQPPTPVMDTDRSGEDDHRRFATGLERLIFLSDAVFAIAITLLAIDLRLPELPPGQTDASLVQALGELVPAGFAYFISFVVIAGFWIGHFRTFRVVARSDLRLVGLDLALLFFIALLPFPTSVLAQQGDLAAAAIFYAAFIVATGLCSTLVWVYPARAGLLVPGIAPDVVRHITWRAAVVPVLFAASIPLAIVVGPLAAEATWILAVPLQALFSRRFGLQRRLEAALGSPSTETRVRPPA